MRRSWIRLLGVAVALLLALLAASQVILPGVIEGRVESRLTAGGGSAHVEISAFPALGLLLGGRGDGIEVRGSDIPVDLLRARSGALDRLDGFADVDVRLERLRAGPLRAGSFVLRRHGRGAAYRMLATAEVAPAELARYAGRQLGGPLGGLVGDLAGGVLPFGDAPVPVELDAALVAARDGRVRVTDGGGSLAGLPLGPLAELLVEAVAARLD